MIKVEIFGVARLNAGVAGFETNVATLEELKGIVPGVSRKEMNDLIILVNGKSVSRRYKFKDGDVVSLLAPAGGG